MYSHGLLQGHNPTGKSDRLQKARALHEPCVHELILPEEPEKSVSFTLRRLALRTQEQEWQNTQNSSQTAASRSTQLGFDPGSDRRRQAVLLRLLMLLLRLLLSQLLLLPLLLLLLSHTQR